MHPSTLAADLAVRDLTDPAAGPHAIQAIVGAVLEAAQTRYPHAAVVVHRGARIVDVADNYDHLGYSPTAAARDSRYTRYVDGRRMLRSQTSALIPGALRKMPPPEALLVCPGMVYRRDSIDRLHTGTPHQLDLWWIGPPTSQAPARARSSTISPSPTAPPTLVPRSARGLSAPSAPAAPPALAASSALTGASTLAASTAAAASTLAAPSALAAAAPTALPAPAGLSALPTPSAPSALLDLVEAIVEAALPGAEWRITPATHPYTTDGLEIEARVGDTWVEIGECGAAARHVIGPDRHGLALGLGLDRLLMLRKGIDDIRLLRSTDPRVSSQMLDLTPYRPVSAQPAARRDLSVALPADVTPEDLGDRVRHLLGPDAHLVEEVAIESITPPDALPPAARHRLDIRDGEVNVLLRVVLRDLHGALPKQTANALRDRLYEGLVQRGPTTPQ